MRQLLFGKLDPKRLRKLAMRRYPRTAQDDAYDTANGTTLLTPEWDKGNDDRDAIRSSLRLDEHKSASVIE